MLAAHFLRRGYPLSTLDKALSRVSTFTREQLLATDQDPPLDPDSDTPQTEQKKVFSITTFNPTGNPNKHILQNNWNMLGKSRTTLHLFEHRIIHGYRRCPNLRDKLVHAKLKIKSRPKTAVSGSTMNTCTTKNCRYCPKLVTSGKITSPTTKHTYKCCKNITCNTTNVIYCIECSHCAKLYVGQTKRPLKKRMMEHFGDISRKDPNKPLGHHFSRTGHPGLETIRIYVLKFIQGSPDFFGAKQERDFQELQWIHRLKCTLPYGLNAMD